MAGYFSNRPLSRPWESGSGLARFRVPVVDASTPLFKAVYAIIGKPSEVRAASGPWRNSLPRKTSPIWWTASAA